MSISLNLVVALDFEGCLKYMYDVGCFIKPKNRFEIIKDVSSFMCNSNNRNSIYSYKPCLGSMIQSLFYVRIVPILSSKLSRLVLYC